MHKENPISFKGRKVVIGFTFLYSEGSRGVILEHLSEQVQSVLITFICEVPEVKNETKHPIMFRSAVLPALDHIRDNLLHFDTLLKS